MATSAPETTPPPSYFEHLRKDWPLLVLNGLVAALASWFVPSTFRDGDWGILALWCLAAGWAVWWLFSYLNVTVRRFSTIRVEKAALQSLREGSELPERWVARHERMKAKDQRRGARMVRRRQLWRNLAGHRGGV